MLTVNACTSSSSAWSGEGGQLKKNSIHHVLKQAKEDNKHQERKHLTVNHGIKK